MTGRRWGAAGVALAGLLASELTAQPQTTPNAASTPAPAKASVSAEDVIAHLEKTIAWYRHVDALVQGSNPSEEILRRDNTHKYALQSLQLAFAFARAQAARLLQVKQQAQPDAGTGASSQTHNMEQASLRAVDRVNGLQARITDLDAAVDKAKGKARDLLVAQRQELSAELGLAKEIQKTLQSMVSFVGTTGPGSSAGTGLSAQITDLERTVPEARVVRASGGAAPAGGATAGATTGALTVSTGNGNATAVSSAKGASARVPHPESEGVLTLIAEMFSMGQVRGQIDTQLSETDALLREVDQIRSPLVAAIRDSVARSDALASAARSDDLEALAAGQKEVAALEAEFKQSSTVIVPLGEQQIVTESARGELADWRNAVTRESGSAGRYLLLRLGMLLAGIFVILVVSDLWRRATFRYIKDARRRRQFTVLRRVVTTGAITLLLTLGLITEFGSIATYAGFLTAGIAVALQNPILSVVAYFFLIGKYGIRVGDRVTIAGVTGDVVDMGLVRIYMMEVGGVGTSFAGTGEMRSTGRVVVFSNSVLFQPAAIFKQMPGTDYTWHAVHLTLTRESDFGLADKVLCEAVESVYGEYREAIEEQHAVFARSLDVSVDAKTIRPENRMRFTDAGLEAVLRYPVQGQNASATDEKVLKALYEAIANEPKLALAASGEPRLVPQS